MDQCRSLSQLMTFTTHNVNMAEVLPRLALHHGLLQYNLVMLQCHRRPLRGDTTYHIAIRLHRLRHLTRMALYLHHKHHTLVSHRSVDRWTTTEVCRTDSVRLQDDACLQMASR